MSREIKNIFKVSSIYMATIIGAGFASGQEIVQFFSNYYQGGFYGIILAGLLFSVIGYVVLDQVYRERIQSYEELLFPAVGWFIGWVVEIAVSIFMLSVFCIMIAGAGNIFQDKLGLPFTVGVMLMAGLCMIALLTDMKGMVVLSSFVTPILIIGIIVVGVLIIAFKDVSVFSASEVFLKVTNNWVFSSLLYVGYNSIISIVIMSSLLPQLKTRRVGKMGGIIGGFMLCFIAFILNIVMFVIHPESLVKELPVLSITEKYSSLLSCVYSVILWLAMFISAVTSGYCFIDRIHSKTKVNRKVLTIIICLFIIPLSNFGFSNLISKVYPIFGYIGLFIVAVILIQSIKTNFYSRPLKR